MNQNTPPSPKEHCLLADRSSNPTQPATLSEKRFSPSKLAALAEVALDLGLDMREVLAGTGLSAEDVANPFILTSTLQFLTAARNTIRLCPRSDLGVQVGRLLHASSYGMFGYAGLCSESMADAFNSAIKFHQLANGMLGVSWNQQGDLVFWNFSGWNETKLPEIDADLYHFLVDMQFALHVTVVKDIMGTWCVPVRAEFMRKQPPHAKLLSETLECPLLFEQPCNRISYPSAWLPRVPQLAHPVTAAQVSLQCARLLDEIRNQSDITQRVYQILTRTPGKFPEIDAVASDLCMTARTLRRKLDAAGTSYNELLTSVRRALAIDYLSTTTLSIEDIAFLLGFSDAVSFRHAFKRWMGITPNDIRRNREKWINSVEAMNKPE
ncbi:AraC family transcriptional regulator [Burkholderia sp. TSV86]|uniref:AraC family transcriptional regulator n=1 Tax=Burkholderia sp. TSV86 TaxID=1385594 RepID=UPI00075B591C|nr:AraC family transcriptional regulator [Burkholderia sp. TSV86]KVE31217.1 AraC family transcriptional regulator [Burkholderia sp. TSV86]